MKKLISLFITLVLVLTIGACNSAPQDTDLEERVEQLESEVELLKEFYENVVSVRANNQVDYYVNDGQTYYLSASYMDLLADKTEKDYLDKTKFPDYIWDNDGEYIDISELMNMLTIKYLNVPSTTTFGVAFNVRLNGTPTMDSEDLMVRLSMMIVELAEYDFYTIDSTTFAVQFMYGGSSSMVLTRMVLLVDDSYVLHPAIFWNGLLDTRIQGITYSKDNLETMYNDYVTNETFTGYVLPNYK